jgi:hypothetical protein
MRSHSKPRALRSLPLPRVTPLPYVSKLERNPSSRSAHDSSSLAVLKASTGNSIGPHPHPHAKLVQTTSPRPLCHAHTPCISKAACHPSPYFETHAFFHITTIKNTSSTTTITTTIRPPQSPKTNPSTTLIILTHPQILQIVPRALILLPQLIHLRIQMTRLLQAPNRRARQPSDPVHSCFLPPPPPPLLLFLLLLRRLLLLLLLLLPLLILLLLGLALPDTTTPDGIALALALALLLLLDGRCAAIARGAGGEAGTGVGFVVGVVALEVAL